MSCVNTYEVGPFVESGYWSMIATKALTLDKADFLLNGYLIDEDDFQKIPSTLPTPSSSKKKTKSNWKSAYTRLEKMVAPIIIDLHDLEDLDDEEDDDEFEIQSENPVVTPLSQDIPGS